MAVFLSPDYRPSVDEENMNERQREYFRRLLIRWRESLLAGTNSTRAALEIAERAGPDFVDQAAYDTDRELELRTRDRERKLLKKIDEALARIEDGSYGYCAETGQPIGLARLEARPVATLCIAAQERHERDEKRYDRD